MAVAKKKAARRDRVLPMRGATRNDAGRATETVYLFLHPTRMEIPLYPTDELQRQAMRWPYVLRNRVRWSDGESAEAAQRHEARALIASLLNDATTAEAASGKADSLLWEIARAELVEVNIPYTSEEEDWVLRILPWEYLISAATYDERGTRRSTVVRRLYGDGVANASKVSKTSPRPTLLHVENAPAGLRSEFDFESERQLVEMAASAKDITYKPITDLPAAEITARIVEEHPRIIHVSGFDAHQGRSLLDLPEAEVTRDGYTVLGGADKGAAFVEGKDLAAMLVPDHESPWLVSLNIYHSGARLAPLCVAQGAQAAIGFQDTFDDRLAEIFFSAFYRGAAASNWNLASSFRYAIDVVVAQKRPMNGSGITLWTRQSIADMDWTEGFNPSDQVTKRPAVSGAQAGAALALDIRPRASVNYSVLHNGGSLFERFVLSRTDTNVGAIRGLCIAIELHAGQDSFPCRMLVELGADETAKDLAPEIKVSLASALSRSVREGIQTALFVEVRAADVLFHQSTHRVTLLPVDEWIDDDLYRQWLPSFVLPRDPAVPRIIHSAQRYLMALRDDPSAGFDGYQSVDRKVRDAAVACADVDLQVRAIWSALLHEHPLSYINPPPTFSAYSQRLRTPSDVLDGQRGTCIDLALLFSACLEYVEIYPAIILLKAHAFPAYWRSDAYFEAFQDVADAGPAEGDMLKRAESFVHSTPQAGAAQKARWYLTGGRDGGHYKEIIKQIRNGWLVPVETVMLTAHTGFAEAVAEGLRNFTGPRDFDSMLDVRLARQAAVTPLPVRRMEM